MRCISDDRRVYIYFLDTYLLEIDICREESPGTALTQCRRSDSG